MHESLIGQIYEAGVVPERWMGVLEQLGHMAGGLGAVLFVPGLPGWIATPGVDQMFSEFVSSGLVGNNERTKRLVAANHPGFLTDQDVFGIDEIPVQDIYRDFFIPRGGGFGVATVIPSPSGDTMIIHAERAFATGPVEWEAVRALDALRPHLARASLLSARVELQRMSAIAAALEMIGLPGAVLGHGGRVMFGNTLLERLVPTVVQDRQARITLVNKNADALLAEALAALRAGQQDRVVASIPIPAAEDQPPLIVHLVPVHGVAHEVFTSAAAIVVITPVVPKEVPSAEVVQGLFDLTPAEARVAREIGHGKRIPDIAVLAGSSPATVRSQVKSILGKTGLHRQADLIGLLQGISIFSPPRSDAN